MKSRINRKNEILYILSLVFSFLFILQTFYYCNIRGILDLDKKSLIKVTIYLVGMSICAILILSLANDKPWDKQNRILFRLIFILSLLFHCDIAVFLLNGHKDSLFYLRNYLSLFLFIECLLIYSFWLYVCEELHVNRKQIPLLNWLCRSILIITLILSILNRKFDFFFDISPAAIFSYGKYIDVCDILEFILYIAILYVVLKDKTSSWNKKAALLSFQFFQIIAHILSISSDAYALVMPAYLLSILLIYINVFSVRGKKLLEQQVELNQQRTTLMISQIQPHFLYNVLTTISNLCATDPEEAEETTVLFAQYLRTNIDSLNQSEPIPFRVELGHIKTYIELEKKRFGEKINVEIDCPETDFPVPVLGLQPIAENSIKHGIRFKETPGHLKISSRKLTDGYEVVIEDDGIGFDMNAPLPDDGRKHVGMVNVKARLEQMCGARVTVLSSPGNGCKTTIYFPENN